MSGLGEAHAIEPWNTDSAFDTLTLPTTLAGRLCRLKKRLDTSQEFDCLHSIVCCCSGAGKRYHVARLQIGDRNVRETIEHVIDPGAAAPAAKALASPSGVLTLTARRLSPTFGSRGLCAARSHRSRTTRL